MFVYFESNVVIICNIFAMAKEPSIDDFISLITSPKTNKIYNDPIVLDTGEIEELNEYLVTNQKNPYHSITKLKTLITTFLDEYPEYKSKQYVAQINNKNTHRMNQKTINNIINSKTMTMLKKYTNFEAQLFTGEQISKILNYSDQDTILYFMDNLIGDVHVQLDGIEWRMINYVCNRCSADMPEVVKHFIKKYGGLEHYCHDDNWYPLHQILYYSKDNDLTKMAIDHHLQSGLDLYQKNTDDHTILNFVFSYGTFVVIQHTMDKIDKQSQEFKDCLNDLYNAMSDNEKISEDDEEILIQQLLPE